MQKCRNAKQEISEDVKAQQIVQSITIMSLLIKALCNLHNLHQICTFYYYTISDYILPLFSFPLPIDTNASINSQGPRVNSSNKELVQFIPSKIKIWYKESCHSFKHVLISGPREIIQLFMYIRDHQILSLRNG